MPESPRPRSESARGRNLVDNLNMRPSISEFSYGFAVTAELLQALGPVTVAPVFPSLRAEGKEGGGWDVRLDWPGFPLFLQFKLCDQMTRRTCKEARLVGSRLPCYRMHLRPTRLSPQHRLLLELEQRGKAVYYCAPMFHETEEFNNAFRQHSVCSQSIWIRPWDINFRMMVTTTCRSSRAGDVGYSPSRG